jgi:hypothetical protein
MVTHKWIPMPIASPIMKAQMLSKVFIKSNPVIETGTYLGYTSVFLKNQGYEVITIEIDQILFDRVHGLLKKRGVDHRLGDSAILLPEILRESNIQGVNIYLDGHFSGGITGKSDEHETPVELELQAIENEIKRGRIKDFVICIDDFRVFGKDPAYPPKAFLVEYAQRNTMDWSVVFDVFIMSNRDLEII